jgi:hypothetical protein
MLEMIFNGANWFALPFWAMMILLPGWKVTRKVMESLLPIALLAAVYLYLLVTGFNADVLKEFSNPQLSLTSLTDPCGSALPFAYGGDCTSNSPEPAQCSST